MSKDLNMVKNIGMIGDSIAHGYYDEQNLGYFARLAQKILSYHKGEYVFNNMSQSGDNIADATHRALSEALSRHFDLILVNARYDLWKNRNLNEFYKDATHPNALGHQIMADEIYDYLNSHNLI